MILIITCMFGTIYLVLKHIHKQFKPKYHNDPELEPLLTTK